MRLPLKTGFAAFAVPAAAFAQHSPDRAADPFHGAAPRDIVVTAPFERNQSDILSGTSVLSGLDLNRELKSTLGETLNRQAGVSSTAFGPNASRPVLRGFQGERVRILTDGIGSFDVSNTSVDHAVVINPLTADRIEVLRGPAALLFGSSAIGGVVNVIDSRIPRAMPDEAVHLDAIATYGSAADERSARGEVEAPVGGRLVVHFDGSYSRSGDLDIGEYALSPALRREAAASGDPAVRDLARLRGSLPNSAARTWDIAGGAAIIADGGNFGVSVSRYDSLYGVPVRFSLDPAAEAEEVRLDVRQWREDMRAEIETGGGFLDKIRFRAGHADYRHSELEETGEVGTTFFSDSYEARIELAQAKRGPWRGVIGGQMLIRNFRVVGEEAFLPENETGQYGFFTLQELDLGRFKAEAGGRIERSHIDARASETLGNPAIGRRFTAYSGSIGASYALVDGLRIGLNAAHSERAPAAEELFPNGPHAGTQAFEVGDPAFAKEKGDGIEATLHANRGGFSLSASAYYSRFENYIYEIQTGEVEDGLPVYRYAQGDARYHGFEVEGSARLGRAGGWTFVADALADYVRATIKSVGPAPRIPPLRLLGGIEAQSERVQARAEVEWVDGQKRIAAFETPTRGYTLVNASLSFQPFPGRKETSIMLSANNIFDVDARRHASFLKDYAPLSGRDIRVTARLAL